MVSVTVYNRNGTKELEFESGGHETVGDVKRMLDSGNSEGLQLVFQNEILQDSTVLATLGEDVELMVGGDIKFTLIDRPDELPILPSPGYEPLGGELLAEEIEPKPCSGLVGRVTSSNPAHAPPRAAAGKPLHPSRPSDRFTLNGKTYRITRRRRRLTLKNILEKLEAFFTPTLLFQCLMLLFILHTNNIFVLVVLLSIRSLRMLSNVIRRHRLWRHVKGHGMQVLFMFFASLALLDHPSFYNASAEGIPQPAPDD